METGPSGKAARPVPTVTQQWHDEDHSIVLEVYSRDWTVDDLVRALHNLHQMMLTTSGRVDTISDFRQPGQLDSALAHLHRIGEAATAAFERSQGGLQILVQPAGMLRVLVRIYIRLFPDRGAFMRVASSIEEAERLIAEDRAKSAKGPSQFAQ
ncbi:MAG: hypothetical protein GYB68_14875 [Chloroflexi bacterium]|nr:hypothetical protein [Chloroflexota bacterium]